MLIRQGLDREFLLALLNDKPLPADHSAVDEFEMAVSGRDDASELIKWVHQPEFLNEKGVKLEPIPLKYEPAHIDVNAEVGRYSLECAINFAKRRDIVNKHKDDWPAVARSLRSFVDSWTDSGYDESGQEFPYRRHLAQDVWVRLQSFVNDNPPSIRVQEWGALSGWWADSYECAGAFIDYEPVRLMCVLLGSDLRYTIAKCRNCPRYFVRSRMHETFKMGGHCLHHSKGAGTALKRKKEREELLRLAARFLSSCGGTRDPKCSRCVAEKVKEHRKKAQLPITQKWVSRNFLEIQHLSKEHRSQTEGE